MTALKKLFAAALVALLPFVTLAQTPAAEPAKPAEAPKPPEDVIKVTPYGFVLANAFFNSDTFATRDYPGGLAFSSTTFLPTPLGGSFLMSARQSRIGMRLSGKDTAFTGADLTGVLEFDFKAGHIPGAAGATPASTTWYNGVMRLRLASATATWKFTGGSFSVLAGQDYGLMNPLFAESLAWVADPLFWQAGNLWRRSPQFRLTYSGNFAGVGLTLAGAMLSPADGTASANGLSIDFGPGNRSRRPDIEGRAALSYKAAPDMNGTVGVTYSFGKRRATTGAALTDVAVVGVSGIGIDAEINVPFLTVKGEWYKNQGYDDSYNGIFSPGFATVAGPPAVATAVDSDGYWAQAIVKPVPVLSLTLGYGVGNANAADLTAAGFNAATRKKNSQLAAGVLVNAGKWWRFGLEWIKVETTSLGSGTVASTKKDGTQIAISSQLKF